MGEERYTPFQMRHVLLNSNLVKCDTREGQLSLAKYLLIADAADKPDIHDIPQFFRHLLERVDWRRDLHFQTDTTIDTLDYSSEGLNTGSKVVWACRGAARRALSSEQPNFPEGIEARVIDAGILAVGMNPCTEYSMATQEMESLVEQLGHVDGLEGFPLVIACDDPKFLAADYHICLWATLTRSNP